MSERASTEREHDGNETRAAGRERESRPDGRSPDRQSPDRRSPVAALHGVVGNRAVAEGHERDDLMAKLSVSRPSDAHEREAERVAEEVARSDREDPVGERVPDVSRRTAGSGGPTVTGEAEERIESLRGGGRTMGTRERSFFESRFDRDFGDVRVHTGAEADGLARSMNAEAFTVGNDVFFAEGNYRPETRDGRELVAHELTHVVQQGESGPRSVYTARETLHRQSSGETSGDIATRVNEDQADGSGKTSVPDVTELDWTTEMAIRAFMNGVTNGWFENLSSLARVSGYSIGVGLSGEAMGVGGGAGGFGVAFFPDGSIGGYGSLAGGLGASISAEITVDVTLIDGGKSAFNGDLWFVTVGGGATVGPAGAVSVLFEDDPNQNPDQDVIGVSLDGGIGASLTVIDIYVGYEDTNAGEILDAKEE